MSFSDLASLLQKLGPNLPAFIAFAQAVYSAWLQLQAAIGAAPKLQARMITVEDSAQVHNVVAAANLTAFDGHRVASLMKFLAAHPELLAWALAAFGVAPPPMPVNPPAPPTTA